VTTPLMETWEKHKLNEIKRSKLEKSLSLIIRLVIKFSN